MTGRSGRRRRWRHLSARSHTRDTRQAELSESDVRFLQRNDTLNVNSYSSYGATEHGKLLLGGFMEVNARLVTPSSRFVYYGGTGNTLHAQERTSLCWVALDMPSLDVVEEFDSLDAMLEQIRRDAYDESIMAGRRTMRTDDVALMLQIRRARESSAERALMQAQQAEARAAAQRGRINEALTAFAAHRRAQEAAVSRTLAAGPVTGLQMRLAAAQLAAIVADAERLRQSAEQAARREAACADATRGAQRAFATATRDALGVSMLQRQVDAATRIAAAREADGEMEEAAGLCAAGRLSGARP